MLALLLLSLCPHFSFQTLSPIYVAEETEGRDGVAVQPHAHSHVL